MHASRTASAGIVGKYAKIGLVLFYALQVTVLFREQIVHFYRTAREAVHVGKEDAHVAAAHAVGDKHRDDGAPREDGRYVAASSLPSTILLIAHEAARHDPHPHHGEDRKDVVSRHRRDRRGEWVIIDLYSRIKNALAPQGSGDAHKPATIRSLRFTAA